MEITSVVLKNFKIHQDQRFKFAPGINAICGENGAGKTSIIEALAWVLFDYSGYTKTDLIRNGAKSAQAWVNFISSYDERSYRIQRCTTKGYEIYDPQLQRSLGLNKRDDITRWVRQQLGISADLSLSNLFSEMIGIPQGTFTADFLKNPEGRKKVFDPILRVDDYKNAFQKALNLEKYSQAKVLQLQQQCQLYQQQLADWEILQDRERVLQQELNHDQQQLAHLTQALEALQSEREQNQVQAELIQTLTRELEQHQRDIQSLQTQQHQQSQHLAQAQTAATLCQTHAPAYQAYLELAHTLQHLNQQLQNRVNLEKQAQQQQTQLLQAQTHLSQLEFQLEQLAAAATQINTLTPQIPAQLALEHDLQALRADLATLNQATADYDQLCQEQGQLQAEHAQLTAEITELESLKDIVATIPSLENQLQQSQQQQSQAELSLHLHQQLSHLLDQSQNDLHELENLTSTAQGFIQTWPETLLGRNTVLLALEQSLDQYRQLYQALAHFSGGLLNTGNPAELEQLQRNLDRAKKSQLQYATLSLKQAQQKTTQTRLSQVGKQLEKVKSRLEQLPGLEAQAQDLAIQLATLDNPQAKVQHLQAQLSHQEQLNHDYQTQTQVVRQIQDNWETLQQQLTDLATLEQQRQEFQHQQQAYTESYQTYLQNINLAQQIEVLQANVIQTQNNQTILSQIHAEKQQKLNHLVQNFDADHLGYLNQQISQIQSQVDQLHGSLPFKQAQFQELQAELQARQSLAAALKQLEATLDNHQKIDQFIQVSRQVFNQSGPRITQYYMSSIIQVADQLFRELLNRPDVALAWTEDYEIRIQEGGHWRGFKSLSGGEQMCGALAIRLALLKVLVEIDIAFFDEPTTNMDAQRRSQLATALSNLRSFHQLFVISHDDAFEHMTENIIRVNRLS